MNATELIPRASRELSTIGIDSIIETFTPIFNEFEGYLEGIHIKKPYKILIDGFLHFLKITYDLNEDIMLVNTGNYTTGEWGSLYWSFLHLSSILLQNALEQEMVNDVRGFPAILYNIDEILPCSVCQQHYLEIKESTEIRQLIKIISFGHIIQGTFHFHALITHNINEMNQGQAPKPDFLSIDFCRLYNCYPNTLNDKQKLSTLARVPIDWQTNIHIQLSIFLAIASQVSYFRASNRLKRIYGITAPLENQRLIHPQEFAFEKYSDEEIFDILNKCLEDEDYPKDSELSEKNRGLIANARKSLRELDNDLSVIE